MDGIGKKIEQVIFLYHLFPVFAVNRILAQAIIHKNHAQP